MKKRKQKFATLDQKKPLSYKTFWASMSILFLLSFLVMLSSLENVVTGHATVQNIATAKAGSTLTLEVKTIPGVKEATLYFDEAVKNSQISFTEDTTLPFSGVAYVKFTVSSPDEDKIGKIDFTFKVHELDLRKAGINYKDLRLVVNSQEVPTVLLKKEKEYYYYSASATGFGTMILAQKQERQEPVSVTTVPFALPMEDVALPSEQAHSLQPEGELFPESVAGKAGEQEDIVPPEHMTFWQRVKNFFKNLFS